MPHTFPGQIAPYTVDATPRKPMNAILKSLVTALVFIAPACGADGTTPALPTTSPSPPNADSIEVRGAGFKTPACVVWDKIADVYLVSNIHGHPLAKDDSGFISRVRPDGTVEALKWIDGASEGVTLHAPKGMAILRDRLWVADIDVLRGFDRSTGRALKEVPVPGATQMNKIISFPNARGVPAGCLVTDTEQWRPEGPDTMRPGTSFLHIFDLDHGEVTTTPNNPWVRPGRVRGGIFGADSDLQSAHPFGQVTGTAMTPQGFGLVAWDRPWAYNIESGYDLDQVGPIRLPQGQSYDVIVLPPVWRGEVGAGERWLISSWAGRCLYVVQLDDLPGTTVSEWVSGISAPAKLGYDVKRNRVLVPLYLDDALLIRPGPKVRSR